ncbi:MAG: GGDEF domain-containing protein [Bacillota bacterium]|nr:GGDEF domain-containing protein [Bacillota bacterium]
MDAQDGDELAAALRALRLALDRLEEAVARLHEEAIRDPLTGAFNRRFLEARLAEELARAERYGTPFALLFLDLDDFKRYNDRHGHLAGDRLLAELATLWRSTLRQADELFRFGGDEFVILLPETGRAEASEIATRLREGPRRAGARVTISVGVAAWPEDGRTPEALLAAADRWLYETKRSEEPPGPVEGEEAADGHGRPPGEEGPPRPPAGEPAAGPAGGPEALRLNLGYDELGSVSCIWVDGRPVRVLSVQPVEGDPGSLALLTEEGRWILPRRALHLLARPWR